MAMAIEDIQAMGIDLENVDQLASLLEGLEDVNPGGGQEVVSGGVDSEAIEQALLQTLGTMTREQIEEAIASCQQLGVEAGTVPSDSDKNAHSNNGVYEGPHEPDAIKYKGSEFRVDMEGLGEVQHLPQGGHYDLSGIQLDEQTLSELQQLNESILGLGNDGQGGIGKLLQQSDIDNSGGQALMMDNQEDSLRQRRMSDTGNNIGSFGGGARTHDAASPHLSVFSDHTAPATQSVGKAPDSEVQSLINLDLTSLPEDETQISSWIAEQLHTLQDTGDEVGERLDRFMNGKRSSSVEHRNTGRGRTLSESRTSSGRVTSLDRDRVREENRERKKRWREINQDRNKDNDLRCRVTKRANRLFGSKNTPERSAWMDDEFRKRREKREAKQRCRSIPDDGGISYSSYMEHMTRHGNSTNNKPSGSSSQSQSPKNTPNSAAVLQSNSTSANETNPLLDSSPDVLAALVAGLAGNDSQNGALQNGGNTFLFTGNNALETLEGLLENPELTTVPRLADVSDELYTDLLSQQISKVLAAEGTGTLEGVAEAGFSNADAGLNTSFHSLPDFENLAGVDKDTIEQIRTAVQELGDHIDLSSVFASLAGQQGQMDMNPGVVDFDPSTTIRAQSPVDEAQIQEILNQSPQDINQLLLSVTDTLQSMVPQSNEQVTYNQNEDNADYDMENGLLKERLLRALDTIDGSSSEASTPKAPPPTPITSRKRSLMGGASPGPKRHQPSFEGTNQAQRAYSIAMGGVTSNYNQTAYGHFPIHSHHIHSIPNGTQASHHTYSQPRTIHQDVPVNRPTIPRPPFTSKPKTSAAAHAASFGNSAAMNQRLMMPPAFRPPSMTENYGVTTPPKKKPDEKIVKAMGFPPLLAGIKKK